MSLKDTGKLALITCPFFGINFAWQAEFLLIEPYFTWLDLPDSVVDYSWVAGPVAGIIAGPLVGIWSDRNTSKYGRRRVFMLAGGILVIILELILAFSMHFPTENRAPVAFTIFFLLDCCINVIQTPIRALIADFAAPEQQEIGQCYALAWSALGSCAAYLASHEYGILHAGAILEVEGLSVIFVAAAVVLALTLAVTLPLARETPISPSPLSQMSFFKYLILSVKGMPSGMVRVVAVQFFAWMAFFCLFPNTSFLGMTNLATAFAVQGVVILVMAVVLMVMLHIMHFSIKVVYCATMVVLTLSFLGLAITTDEDLQFLFVALTGIPLAATNTLPFAIVGKLCDPSKIGLMMGSLNLFIVIPQLLDFTYTPTLLRAGCSHGDTCMWRLMYVASAWSVLAALCCLWLRLVASTRVTVMAPTLSEPLVSDCEANRLVVVPSEGSKR